MLQEIDHVESANQKSNFMKEVLYNTIRVFYICSNIV